MFFLLQSALLRRFAGCALGLAASWIVFGQQLPFIRMVRDLSPGLSVGSGFNPGSTAAIGNVVYFESGSELWRTDGTVLGTRIVRSFNSAFDALDFLTNLNGTLIFAATGRNGVALWRSDGSATGTFLLQRLGPGLSPSDRVKSELVVFQASVYFLTTTELWRSDGTPQGTAVVRSFSRASGLRLVNGALYFAGCDSATGCEPWTSDGTAQGTRLLADVVSPGSSNPDFFTGTSNAVLFRVDNAVWRTDGTPQGTIRLKPQCEYPTLPFPPGFPVPPSDLRSFNGIAVFYELCTGSTSNLAGLWRSDGTVTGTFLIQPATPVNAQLLLWSPPFGGSVYFLLSEGNDTTTLWKTDGSPQGTQLVRGQFDGDTTGPFWVVGGQLLFAAADAAHGVELWRTDGTTNGTAMVHDLFPGPQSSDPNRLVQSGGNLFFVASDASSRDLWKASLTAQNPARIRSTLAPNASSPGQITDVQGTAFFVASTPPSWGAQIWKSMGTASGTSLVFAFPSDPNSLTELTPAGSKLYFRLWAFPSHPRNGIWVTDGTTLGTRQVVQSQNGHILTAFQGQLFYREVANPQDSLWKTDGTSAGTVRVALTNGQPHSPFVHANVLYFLDEDSIWKSDGTPSGTVRVKQFPWRVAGPMAALNGEIFFQLSSSSFPNLVAELWKTNGTNAGTVLVKALSPSLFGQPLAAVGSFVYITADDPNQPTGSSLWRSDGTAQGTIPVRKFTVNPPENYQALPDHFTDLNGTLVFVADDGLSGEEIWRSDGTPQGTWMVRDINPGTAGSKPFFLRAFGSTILFSANDSFRGVELWRTDGTAMGTSLLSDIWAGPRSSFPGAFVASGLRIFFSANDGLNGHELWALDPR